MNQNVYITGVSGQIGTHLGRYLRHRGYSVTGADIAQPPADACDYFEKLDILAAQDLAASLRRRQYGSVVHLAAIVAPTEEPPSRIFEVNVHGTYNVAHAAIVAATKAAAAQTTAPRFIFMSSESVLGFAFSGMHWKPSQVPITEHHPLRAIDPYGASKLLGERIATLYHDATGAPTFSLRPPWVWVPEKYDRYLSLIENPSEWAHSLWAYIVIEDLCAAVERAMICEAQGSHAVFLAADDHGTPDSSFDLLKRYYEFAGPFGEAFGQEDSIISSQTAKTLLGWKPRWNWRTWMDHVRATRQSAPQAKTLSGKST